jgi:branched-chain amino acid transport system substrate-binding protein
VTAPGVEQKTTWLQIRQQRPDYVLLWSAGIMTPTALREAVATAYPRDRIYGIWWAGGEPDVQPLGADAAGYRSITLSGSTEGLAKVHQDVLKYVYDKGAGAGKREDVGNTLYTRGLMNGMLTVEAIRRAQARYGKRPITGQEARWGLENLALDQRTLNALGFGTFMKPVSTSCQDHEGSRWARIHAWDGKHWAYSSDWYEADSQIIRPMVKAAAAKYLAEHQGTARSPSDCQS